MTKPLAKTFIAVAAATALAFGLTGCGGDDAADDALAEEVSTPATETPDETEEIDEDPVDPSEEPDAGTGEEDPYTVDPGEGFYVDNSSTGDAQLPEGFPADMPTIDAPTMQVISEEGTSTWTLYQQVESLDVLDDFIANELAGWEQQGFVNDDTSVMYIYVKGNYQVMFQGAEASGGGYDISYQAVVLG